MRTFITRGILSLLKEKFNNGYNLPYNVNIESKSLL